MLLTSHPRSGTTLLEQVLDSHPGAISADELQIMSDMVYVPLGQKAQFRAIRSPKCLDRTPLEDLNELRQAYWTSMEGALREPINGRLLIDKNPELTLLLPLVARVFPEMKVLFALRDPRDVVISCFTQQLPLNPVSVHYLTLEGTVKKYVKMMQAWLKLRGMLRNPWIEIRYEDMVADLEGQARKALEFLGLPWDERVLDYHRRAKQKHVHSPTYEAVTKPVYSSSVGRWRNYEKQLEPYQDILQPFVEAFGYEYDRIMEITTAFHNADDACGRRRKLHRALWRGISQSASRSLSPAPPKPVSSLKVMTYNIYVGGAAYGPLSRTVGVIQTAQADVIGIQEVGGSAQAIANSLGFYYHGFDSDLAIISRYPITQVLDQGVRLHVSPTQDAYLFNVHLDGVSLSAV